MKVLFLHGWQSVPGGVKPTFLAQHRHEVSNRCFQLRECDDMPLFPQWVARWVDLVDFEIVAVCPSKEAAAGHELSLTFSAIWLVGIFPPRLGSGR